MRHFRFQQGRIRKTLTNLEERIAPATLPTGFSEFGVSGVITSATAMEFAPDGKLFVLEQAGTMEVYSGTGATSWTQQSLNNNFFHNPATGTSVISVDSYFERGLLGIAFDPNYLSNHFLYVYYTVPAGAAPVHNRLSRFTSNAAGTQVVPGSELAILDLETLSAGNHNGGAIHFGPDNKLYVAIGENAVPSNAQSLTTRKGKMLRINPDPANLIPADNPTTIAGLGATSGDYRQIWAAGLRNPFTFTFHPITGRMHINDVGQNTYEEINLGVAGANYGWSATEGPFNQGSFPNYTHPLVAYPQPGTTGTSNYPVGTINSSGQTVAYTGEAITGGAFYITNSAYTFPQSYIGDYFYADYIADWIRRYDYTENKIYDFATGAGGCVDLKIGPDGALYYLSHDAPNFGSGRVYRVDFTGSSLPYVIVHPTNQTTSEGQPVTFTVQAGGPGTLSYVWQRGTVDIPGANSASYTIPMTPLSENGMMFRVRITNTTGSVFSNSATLTVNMNQPPVPTIDLPLAGARFNYGQTVSYSGSATDPEDGTITNPSRFTWWVTYFTTVATSPTERPFIPEFSGVTSGNFMIPNVSPYTEPDVFYRVHLRVQDSFGTTAETFTDLLPNTAQVTLATNPASAPLLLDGATKATPHMFTGVTGQIRSLGAPASATIAGLAYSFASWSDAGAIVHDIATPAANTTFTANYVQRPPRVASFIVDDGSGQRSRVRSLQVVFDAIVNPVGTLGDGFMLNGPSGTVPLIVGPIDNSTGRSIIPISFSGGGLNFGSLPMGLYSFSLDGAQLQDTVGSSVDGDANGTIGGLFAANFHRLFGDVNGDRVLNGNDFALFRFCFGSIIGQPEYYSFLDYNGDGSIGSADFAEFRKLFGTMI